MALSERIIQRRKRKKKLFLEVLKENLGIISSTCQKMGMDRSKYYDWIKEDPEFDKQCQDIQEHTKDFVENKLFEAISQGNIAAIIFYLKCKVRDRGYIEQPFVGEKGNKMEVIINVREVPQIAIVNKEQISHEEMRAIDNSTLQLTTLKKEPS